MTDSLSAPPPVLAGLPADRFDAGLSLVTPGALALHRPAGAPPAEPGAPAAAFYDEAALARIAAVLRPGAGPDVFPARLGQGSPAVDCLLLAVPVLSNGAPQAVDLLPLFGTALAEQLAGLAESNGVMWNIIQTAREAIWCIRYEEPVDVTLDADRIVDQIFEHRSVWSLCNAAMARAYDLPDETDLSSRSVRFHWPRNGVNEAFIREIIAHGFRVDGAISEDYRQDGTPVLVENDVRAHIAEGRLYRLWGTLREVTPAEQPVTVARGSRGALAFETLPLPAALLSSDGRIAEASHAWKRHFGPAGEQAARRIYRTISPDMAVGEPVRLVLALPVSDGSRPTHLVDACWTRASGENDGLWLSLAVTPGHGRGEGE